MGLFDRFKSGLARTREKIAASFRAVLPFGRKIDEEILDELTDTLLASDMGSSMVLRLMDDVRDAFKAGTIRETQEIVPYLRERVVALWPDTDRALRMAASGPTVILVAGINGSGKTTSVAKLAKHLTDQGKTVILGACDTFRAAAVEQLTIWSERIGVQIVKHQHGADAGAVAYDACQAVRARNADVLIVDTAGRLHTQDHLMRELGKIRRVVEKNIPGAPHEVLLVLDATTGQNALQQAKIFMQHVDVTGIFLAKLDGSAKGGVVIGIRDQINLPVKFVGLGEKPSDIEPFDPATFVEALFPDGDA